jgi:hypothetical protein
MTLKLLVFVWVLAMPSLFFGADAQLKVRASDGTDFLSYNPDEVQRQDLLRWIRLSPNVDEINGYLVPESLELCVDNEPEYLPCGSRDLRDPNFVGNAEVNLGKIRNRLRSLEEGSYPPELQPVVAYFEAIQSTFLQAEQKRLAFLKTWNPAQLSGPVGNIDLNETCPAVLDRLKATVDKQAAYKITKHELHNCINSAFREYLGAYPKLAWEEFLRNHFLREHFVPDEAD